MVLDDSAEVVVRSRGGAAMVPKLRLSKRIAGDRHILPSGVTRQLGLLPIL
jgi:hypothetical protein